MTDQATLDAAVDRVVLLVNNYQRDMPFRAPETVPEWQSRLLNDLWGVLVGGLTEDDVHRALTSMAMAQREARDAERLARTATQERTP